MQQQQLPMAMPAPPCRIKYKDLKTIAARIDFIKHKLETSDAWLKRGILAVYAKQTAHEQSQEATMEHNGVGFNGVDGPIMSSFAKQLKRYGTLSPRQMQVARKIMGKYARQLMDIASV